VKIVRSHEPVRWSDRDAHTLEARAAVLADSARPVPALTGQAVSRIRAEVLQRAAGRTGFFDLRGRPIIVRVAVGLAVVLMCGATADGAAILWRRHLEMIRTHERSTPLPAEAPSPAARPHRRAASNDETAKDLRLDPELAPVPQIGSDELGTKPPLSHVGARVRASASPALAVAPLPPMPSLTAAPSSAEPRDLPPATEAGMVAQALWQLRQQGDPRAALVTLDVYARTFSHGVLDAEASRTRLEALIRLDDRKAALALLDTMPGVSDDPGTELLLTRAELRAAAGRFREALADFSQAMEGEGGVAEASERALYGRAVCLGRLGEDDRARADLLAYERRFLNGQFAGEVRRLLAEPAPTTTVTHRP
jgi:hypothetical protein